jgi:hypothetical protein
MTAYASMTSGINGYPPKVAEEKPHPLYFTLSPVELVGERANLSFGNKAEGRRRFGNQEVAIRKCGSGVVANEVN